MASSPSETADESSTGASSVDETFEPSYRTILTLRLHENQHPEELRGSARLVNLAPGSLQKVSNFNSDVFEEGRSPQCLPDRGEMKTFDPRSHLHLNKGTNHGF